MPAHAAYALCEYYVDSIVVVVVVVANTASACQNVKIQRVNGG